ncbi:MAG: DUF262 domain-containing protein [Clostridia bacterium]|nr:DUF262 domain-containing protein [Clostridia bacterium]
MENNKFLEDSIYNLLNKINDNNRIMLPAIQRKFVWNEEKILKFVDSILLGYPIGIFLFWELTGEYLNDNRKTFKFYEFINYFNDRIVIKNRRIESFKKDIVDYNAVLDGQQRLTALNISINGYIETKKNKYGKNSDVTKKYLYVNLLTKSKKEKTEDELYYDLIFVKDEEREEYEKNFWRPLSEIVNNINNIEEIENYVEKLNIKDSEKFKVSSNIRVIYDSFKDIHKIPYYLIKNADIDTVLELFVRVNSGGQILQKSDLLFSTIISSWVGGREKIDDLIDVLNRKDKGGIYKFDVDYIMRTCLYLLDKPLDMKVNNFKKDNAIQRIQNEWDNIETALKNTVDLLEERHFNDNNITSYNAIMPIVYYIYKKGNYKKEDIKEELFKYFIIAQIKQVFGGSSNTILKDIRSTLVDENYNLKDKEFSLKQFDNFESGNKNFKITEDEIDSWFRLTKGQYTYLVLSLIKEGMDNGVAFHQDHMHPNAILRENEDFKPYKDKLANIQLIPASKNLRKNKEELKEWINNDRKNNVPQECPKNSKGEYIYVESKDFIDFYIARRKLLKEKLYKIFGFKYDEKEEIDIKNDINY